MTATNTTVDLSAQARWCQDALAVQDASNLSGVAHSFADLCVAMHQAGLSTSAICDHPASVLFVAKAADMAGLNYHWPAKAEDEANAIIRRAETSALASNATTL
jgi:hypothetical protein